MKKRKPIVVKDDGPVNYLAHQQAKLNRQNNMHVPRHLHNKTSVKKIRHQIMDQRRVKAYQSLTGTP